MAQYHYDEAGNMAAYFLLTFLALVLVPTTLLSFRPAKKFSSGCQCQPCIQQHQRVSSLKPTFNKKTYFLVTGWVLLGLVGYKVANAELENRVYDPFEILGLKVGTAEKEIKSHYKKLSKLYHPDKVKATANMTIEAIQNRFVELTKAYKALTDETVRENLEKYGNPDGRIDVSMGIAIPKWIVEGKNNIWVLGFYGIIFGGALPALVGRWWFGSRQKTKDGINASSAGTFFKSLKEESSFEEVLGTFAKAFQWEFPARKAALSCALDNLEKQIEEKAGSKYQEVKKVCGDDTLSRKGLILLYAHLLRLDIQSSILRKEQRKILLHTPLLLNALLNIATSRNWLSPSLAVMRLHAYITQAVLPGPERIRFAQLPGITLEEVSTLAPKATDLREFEQALVEKHDIRILDVKTALNKWGRVEIVDAAFRVIGERIVTPSSIVFLVVKLRISPPLSNHVQEKELNIDETKRRIKFNEEKDEEFLVNRKEAEELPPDNLLPGWVHAPYWPGERKPSWWIVLGDEKSNRVVVPPTKVTDVPFAQPNHERDYRSYKIQFQAPQNVGVFTWKVQLISDSFVNEDASHEITLKIEDASTLPNDVQFEDEISDPDEDSIAGQMAAMRGGPVKKKTIDGGSDDESTTDDDENDDDTSSDSDSD
ncbi:Translocation protein sec63 [Termitomyces sp. J132]|nr:hypothetical protein H2248_005891 [Termitomyces sp. 'cryptogamus']KNZ73660.1 Translocation protein sec63 [Termitomyces sp. J132]